MQCEGGSGTVTNTKVKAKSREEQGMCGGPTKEKCVAGVSNVTKASIKMEQGVYRGPSIKLLFKTRSQGWTSS